jgi:hypothetical protein
MAGPVFRRIRLLLEITRKNSHSYGKIVANAKEITYEIIHIRGNNAGLSFSDSSPRAKYGSGGN